MYQRAKADPRFPAIEELRALGVVPAIAALLDSRAPAVVQTLYDRVLAEIEAFSRSSNPDVLPELRAHLEQLAQAVCELLSQRGHGNLAFVADYARTRAEQRFPLEASLNTYRCSHRIFSSWIRDAALATADKEAQVRRIVAVAADFAIEVTDAVSTLATAEYVAHIRLLAEAEGDQRTELLNALLRGYDESDARTARLLRRAGYMEQRQSFCVVVARSPDAREMVNPARAQRMAKAVGQALHAAPVRTLVGIRDQQVVIVVSGTRRQSGWTAPESLLAERILPRLETVGPAALIGLSNDAPSTSHVRAALKEARLALDFASVSRRVVPYARIPFRRMLIWHAQETMPSAPPSWLKPLKAADGRAKGVLIATLQAYADANMNALKAAKGLQVHPNTIYSRVQKITALTGKNPLDYHDLTELLLAAEFDA